MFIARASVRDGLGHLIRTLCVLRELRRHAPVQLLLLGDGSGRHLIDAERLPWTQCASDAHAARAALGRRAKLVVFDTLEFDRRAFDRIANAAATVSLSPKFTQLARVGHIFHRTSVGDPAWDSQPTFPRLHKGLRYTVLPAWLKRVPSRHYREQLREERLAIAISMGGADAPNRTLSLLELFGKVAPKLVIWGALGDAYAHAFEDLLRCAARNRQEIIFLKSNDSMWRVLKNASLVLCAGGLTTYEAAFIGLPAINVVHQPGWTFLFEELEARGACITLRPGAHSLRRAVDLIASLERDRKRLLSIHLATRNLIPAGGAARIARKLHAMSVGA